jgi:hypothetical protein
MGNLGWGTRGGGAKVLVHGVQTACLCVLPVTHSHACAHEAVWRSLINTCKPASTHRSAPVRDVVGDEREEG